MAGKATLEGNVDDKPIPAHVKAKVESTLQSAIEKELSVGGIVPSRHFSVTHFSVVFSKA